MRKGLRLLNIKLFFCILVEIKFCYCKQLGALQSDLTKEVQKMLNSMYFRYHKEGLASRVECHVAFFILQLAKSDAAMIPVYRGLTELHKESSAIVELVRQVGITKRSTRAINDQVLAD